jgi:hypothetical protein
MSAWSITDNNNSKPKSPFTRQVREYLQLTVLSGNTAGKNMISVVYNDGAQNNVANIGVAAGQYVYFYANTASGNGISLNSGGQAGNGVPGMFASNTQVQYVSGNTITLTNPLFSAGANTGWIVEFDKAIVANTSKPTLYNYNSDVVLVNATRAANAVFAGGAQYTSANLANSGSAVAHLGWNKITTFTGGRSGRVQTECLVIVANAAAITIANTISGNTSNSLTYFSGV